MTQMCVVIALLVVSQIGELELQNKLTNGLEMRLVLILAGEFVMGAPASDNDALDDERPAHAVRIPEAFYLGTTEVTQRQYVKVMGDNPSRTKGNMLPVDTVSWNDAVAFCEKLSAIEGRVYRLPTEAEWEYACRAGSTTRYGFGDRGDKLTDFAWFESNSGGKTHSVGKKSPNAWGLNDMHGNVLEWCSDPYDGNHYKWSHQEEPEESSDRVCRGASYSFPARHCRSTSRYGFPRGFKTYKRKGQ